MNAIWRVRIRRLAGPALFVGAAAAGIGAFAQSSVGGGAKGHAPPALTPAQQEAVRRRGVFQWAQQAKPGPKEFILRLYEPIIKGNKKDAERNQRASEQFLEKANDAQNNGQQEVYKKFQALGEAFRDLAAENTKIVAALTGQSGGDLDASFAAIRRIEKQVFDLTGRRIERDWFMPDELRNTDLPEAEAPRPASRQAAVRETPSPRKQ
jgi:hypothetical protein